ncbi:rod shape-determining protein MreC [Ruficoccus amylovorans]|uniref:Cell shape-determining protein MreC n=1 Tax=Ruficoccus amylovorans TaxID=1804625 RepID=A0A842HCV6_9BACT|nr:rod shape-determining protein MreC [Ruficoccus amylovorans]MBC2594080.1 rod shape-determining protein MreC [Ruficoccus amylovorans]
MALKRLSQFKPLVVLLVFLVAWWVMPVMLKRWIQTGFYEFQAPMMFAESQVEDLQSYWTLRGQSKREMIEAGRDLARENARLTVQLQENRTLSDEASRLEALLELPSHPDFRYEVARVARRELSAWWQQIVIRKGANYGIPVGAAVIYKGGVVGRVREVHAYTAVVELISSSGFRMAANVAGEDRPVTYQGLLNPPFSNPMGEVLNVPASVKVSPSQPLRLVSSRLGGIFPEGLTIGQVVELTPGSDGFFQQGRVQLNPDLGALREVAIIVPIEQEGTALAVEPSAASREGQGGN